jgi:hypothetical protein
MRQKKVAIERELNVNFKNLSAIDDRVFQVKPGMLRSPVFILSVGRDNRDPL